MPSKMQFYSSLAEQKAAEVTQARGNWTDFLDTAARLFKYPFTEQMMIYSQRPDAVSCASLDDWNNEKERKDFDGKPWHRMIRQGSKGIALVDNTGSYPRLKYVFDISDTYAAEKSNYRPFIWEMRMEHEAPVTAVLSKIYGDLGEDFGNNIYSIAKQLADEYYDDNAREIGYCIAGSFLEDYDEAGLEEAFKEALTVSVAYSIMSRCNVDTSEYIQDEDFQPIFDFNTPAMVYALGNAVSDLSKQVLRDIELTIKKHERQKNAERSAEHEQRNNVFPFRGLSSSEHQTERTAEGTDGADRQIRQDAESVSGGTQVDNVHGDGTQRDVVSAPPGDGAGGKESDGTDHRGADGENPAAEQSGGPDGLGGDDGQLSEHGRGSSDARTDPRPVNTEQPKNGFAVGAPPGRDEPEPGGDSFVPEHDDPEPTIKALSEILAASSITLSEVDAILRDGGNDKDSILRIAAFRRRNKPFVENEAFLSKEYLSGRWNRKVEPGGKGFIFDSVKTSVWFDETGITIGRGDSALRSKDYAHISWDQAAARVQVLFSKGLLVSQDVLDEAIYNERVELAEQILRFYSDDLREWRNMPEGWTVEIGDWSDDVVHMSALLSDPNERDKIAAHLEADIAALKTDADAPNRFWHSPSLLLASMRTFQSTPVRYQATELPTLDYSRFITEDEVDNYLKSGSHVSESKYRILSFFLHDHTEKERVELLKKEYGHSSGPLAGGGTRHAEPSKGIWLDRPGCEDVKISWSQASRRIGRLIQDGQYMNRAELNTIPAYEEQILAEQISNFYNNLDEYTSPFADDLDFYYPGAEEREALRSFLDDPERVDTVLREMERVYINTPEDDRYYNLRKTVFHNLADYREGKYTLFPGLGDLPDPELSQTRSLPPSTPPPPEQFSLFDLMEQREADTTPLPSVEEQQARIEKVIEKPQPEAIVNDEPPAVSLPITQDEIDALFLTVRNGDKERIAVQFADNPRSREAVQLVREIYGGIEETIPRTNGADGHLWIMGENTGVTIVSGVPFRNPKKEPEPVETLFLPWSKVHKRLSELAADGQFITLEQPTEPVTAQSEAVQPRQEPTTAKLVPYEDYQRIKAENPGFIVMYQLGDFYEFLGQDAEIASNVLEITLLSRSIHGQTERVPMSGIPSFKLDEYIGKLHEAGYGVVVSYLDDNSMRLLRHEQPNETRTAEQTAPAAVAPDETTLESRPYAVGDIVYLEDNKAYRITDIFDNTSNVRILDTESIDGIHRNETKERFERLLGDSEKNIRFMDYFSSDLDKCNPDVLDVLANGVFTSEEKVEISTWLASGKSNSYLDEYLFDMLATKSGDYTMENAVPSMWRTLTGGISIVFGYDHEADTTFTVSWMDAAKIIRALYNKGLNGFSLETPEHEAETVVSSEIVDTPPVPAPELDFDTAAQLIYERVMRDKAFADRLENAVSRGQLRNPIVNALDEVFIENMQQGDPQNLKVYFTDDDLNDRLFDFIYRQAWEQHQQSAMEVEPQPLPEGFTEITDPAEIAEIDAIFGANSQPEPDVFEGSVERETYSLFANLFPEIVNGAYRGMSYQGTPPENTMTVSHDLKHVGEISFLMLKNEPDSDPSYEPLASFETDFDKRTMKLVRYAHTPNDENIGYNAAPSITETTRLGTLRNSMRDLFSLLQGMKAPRISVGLFHDADGNELPAVSRENITEFLREQAEQETALTQQESVQEQTPETADTRPPYTSESLLITPPPVFFVDWTESKTDFDLNLYKDHDVIGYDKSGVEHVIGRSGRLTYVTQTGAFWGFNGVPSNIFDQLQAYEKGEVTAEQVRDNYLKTLEAFKAYRAVDISSINDDVLTVISYGLFAADRKEAILSMLERKSTNDEIAAHLTETYEDYDRITLKSGEVAEYVANKYGASISINVTVTNEDSRNTGYTWDQLAPILRALEPHWRAERTVEREVLEAEPVMVIDNVARNNYNLFALAFPEIVNGTYRDMTFFNEETKRELSISHDTTNAGLIHFDISYYDNGTKIYDPMITLQANFENRMLSPIQYANTLTGEDIGILSLPSPNDAQRLDAISVGIYELLTGITKQGYRPRHYSVFVDAEGKPLPAEPKPNIVAFLKEQADREAAAHFYVQGHVFGGEEHSEPDDVATAVTDSIDTNLTPRYEARQIENVSEILAGHPAFDRISEGDVIYGVWDTVSGRFLTDDDGHISFNSEMGAGAEAGQLNKGTWEPEVKTPRYSIKPVTRVEQISSNPHVVDLIGKDDQITSYGIYDNQAGQYGSYLKTEDGRYITFDTEAEAAAYIDRLNNGLTADTHNTSATTGPKPANFRITDEHLGEGGLKTKYRNNVDAIKTLQSIEFEKRYATPAEQEVLSRYIGWGGLPQVFDPDNKQWENEHLELNMLLSPEEFEKARASTINAHYTTPTVIKAIYETVERIGFTSGNILEPSCGVGNFFGLLPESMAQSKLYGVELDSITARIAKQLYPHAKIQEKGFEKSGYSDNFFDLAIGNVPFGDYPVADKRYDRLNFSIHNYFFAKTLDQVRPGGVVAFLTSKYTLDEKNNKVRKYLAQRADLLGAVRLPNNAFLKNAGTETTTDLIILQKRDRPADRDPDWVSLGLTKDGIPVNSYYAANPEMILGTMAPDERMNNKFGIDTATTCLPIPGADLAEQLHTALAYVQGQYVEEELDDVDGIEDNGIPADPDVKNFSYTLVDGDVYFREDSRMFPVDLPQTTLGRIKGMIGLRNCVNDLIEYQLWDNDSAIPGKQAELNTLYDRFTAEYGIINSTANNRAFSDDSSYYLLCALEILDEDGNLERKADMFTKRTIKQRRAITSVDTAVEALGVSLGERACIDLSFMQSLCGFDKDKIISDLRGVIYQIPKDGEPIWVTADEYLSGNIRQKLAIARDFAMEYEDIPDIAARMKDNISALEAAIPKDLEAHEIAVRLGATWIDPKYIRQFVHELLQPPRNLQSVLQINYSEYTCEWQIAGKARVPYNNVLATVKYGTERMNAYEIIEETLNLRDVRVYDYKEVDGKEVRELNKKETTKAQQRQEMIKQAFKDWLWQDPERRHTLTRFYNDRFNNIRPREYDGSHINFVGMNILKELAPHQRNAVARILYGGNTLLAHVVGAGKSYEMAAAIMESKRLGLSQKSMICVPNHLTDQMASEFLALYPAANLLVAKKKDFEMRNRKKFCAKIATGNYDAVIIGHTQLEKIPISHERQERMIWMQIHEVEQGIKDLKQKGGANYSIKRLEKTKKSLHARLTRLAEAKKKDDVVTFEQLGVDRLYVDEAHGFKNLFLYTKMRNVAGVSTTEAQKSSDLYMKCRYMDELTGGKGVIFATGTPISNSMTELYTMQRYLQYDALERMQLLHFDAWASTFGETVTSLELAPEGTGYRARTRFARFYNLPELMAVFKEAADIQTADMLNLPRPRAIFDTVVVPPTEIQKEMVKELSERAADVQARKVDPHQDNMLKITTDGRKVGLDQRLINPLLPDDEGSKVNACAANIFRIWDETRSQRLTQLAFCDFSTPNKDGRFNVYDDIKAKLLANGVPEHEIAFIHDADTEARKKDLFAKVRQGKVRILFGSTFKMGAGTNVQDKLIALHDLDCPWRPADLEQRSGRIIRRGNNNAEVQIYRYVTESTFDAYLYQTVETKQRYIAQIMTSKSPVRSCEDVDETALSYAEIKALCAGDIRIKEKMDLDIEVARLRLLKADHKNQHYKLEDNLLKYYPEQIAAVTERIAGIEKDIVMYDEQMAKTIAVQETLTVEPPEGGVAADGVKSASVTAAFPPMTILGETYTERDAAAKALIEACKAVKDDKPVEVGTYLGFKLIVALTSFKQHTLTLKGSASYPVDITDTFANISRINGTLRSLPERLDKSKTQLENLYIQVKDAETEMKAPFAQNDELERKEMRLAYLNAELNMDGGRGEQVDTQMEMPGVADDDYGGAVGFRQAINMKGKPSILDGLQTYNTDVKPPSTPGGADRTDRTTI